MTSPAEQIEVICPECGVRFETWYRASINADLDPELVADEEYMKEATTATCPGCGQQADIPTLIVQMEGGASEVPQAEHYPPYITNDEERRRWDVALAIARQLFGDVDEASVWMATRSIYKGDIPT